MTNYKEWKTAISTFDYDYGTLKRYADCGIKAIEISRSWDRQLDIDWAELKANADKAGIELWSCHLPFCFTVNPASLHHETAHTTVLIDSFIMEKAAAVDTVITTKRTAVAAMTITTKRTAVVAMTITTKRAAAVDITTIMILPKV